MAVSLRRPEAGLIHHSDQGSEFVSLAFGQACAKAGIARSMGSRGERWDNAVALDARMLSPAQFETMYLSRPKEN